MRYEDEDDELTPVIHSQYYPVEIPYDIRDQHIFVPGGTRRGKSTQLLKLIMEDIYNGCGVGVLDPKGDLLLWIADQLPADRENDVIYLDLDTPIPIDFMGYEHSNEINPLIKDLAYIITKADASLKAAGPLLNRVLRTLLTVRNTSFMDVYNFYTEEDRKIEILEALENKNPRLWRSWKKWPKEEAWLPISHRMSDFVFNPNFETIFGDPNPALNFSRIMDERKILLVNLGPPHDDNQLYGSLIVNKFQQAALRRLRTTLPQHRIPFFLYIDEFEFFQTETFSSIFSLAGGLGLRLTIGNQFVRQLTPDIKSAVLGNAGSYIIFELGSEDPNLFKHIVAPYDTSWLLTPKLTPHHAVYKIGSNHAIWKHTPSPPDDLDEMHGRKVLEKLRQNTLDEYGPSAQYGENRNTQPPSGQSAPDMLSSKDNGKPDNPPNVPHTEGPTKPIPPK